MLSSMKKIPGEDQAEVNDTLAVLTASLSDKNSIADLYDVRVKWNPICLW
jgi:hypothetical protein